jgi:hypothetical protein
MIRQLATGLDVGPLLKELAAHPEAWDEHKGRTGPGPHEGVSDIWVRYRDISEFDPTNPAAFNEKHESVWYEVSKKIPSAISLCLQVSDLTGERRLAGVLITKIQPGGQVKPHSDHGWHAENTRKIAIQLAGNKQQAFCFEGIELRPEAGDVYEFCNQYLHWVTNDSDEDRITMISCWRTD